MIWLFILFTMISLDSASSPEDFVWKNRILIYSGPGDLSPWLDESQKKSLIDRKLLYFFFEKGKLIESNFDGKIEEMPFLKKLNQGDESQEKWVLIGLDGGVKNSGYATPLPDEVFRIIDAMPMRQSEIKRKD